MSSFKELTMSDPIVAGTRPEVLELEPGRTYCWCRCGRSKDMGTSLKELILSRCYDL